MTLITYDFRTYDFRTYDFRTYDFRPEAFDPIDLDDLCLHLDQSLDLQCGLSVETF